MTVEDLIAKWWDRPGGQEKSNFSSFIPDLCEVLGVSRPGAAEKGKLGAYEYEASIPGGSFRSLKGSGAIDLYRRGHFVMEAKQSWLKPEQAALDLAPEESAPRAPSGARYDALMRDAWLQARNYARNLPGHEPHVPFLIVCDVGRAFELYVDPAGNGRDYEFFPDKQSYRIELPDLASDAEVARTGRTARELLRAIWTEPRTVDPRFHAAEVTRQVAKNLASVSKYLEEGIKAKALSPHERALKTEESSLFLMRILFCMFAEDIGLLSDGKFKDFLERAQSNDAMFTNELRDLFEKMNNANPGSRYASAVESEVRYFNGGLFESSRTYPLGGFVIRDLYEAARQNWRRVEPAIFGTLLEQALSEADRKKLGAHYTPRPYVETLVRATIMDVLEPEWEAVEEEIARKRLSPVDPSGQLRFQGRGRSPLSVSKGAEGVGDVPSAGAPRGSPHPNPSPEEEGLERRAVAARAGIVDRLHEQLDHAVADAYGWGEEWKAGALGPSEIVARLVALNRERAAEEAGGQIRWLRPEYQIPRFGI